MNFISYIQQVALEIVFGVVLGVLVNSTVTRLENTLEMSKFSNIIIHLCVISVVLYIVKVYIATDMTSTWDGHNNFGIIFMFFFLGTQSNIVDWLEEINRHHASI